METAKQEPDEFAPPTPRETLVPVTAVTAIAVVAVVTAVMVKRTEQAAPEPPQAVAASDVRVASADVVKAPPLKAPATNTMGGAPACRECGVVQTVVAVYGEGGKVPRAYQMHIRMDDGSVRAVEQRGALAAGSRVVVADGAVKPMP